MRVRDHDHDHELDAFLCDVRAHCARTDDLERDAGEGPRADFREVVARAHRLDPRAIDASRVDESVGLAPILPLGARGPAIAADVELDTFVSDVRQANDAVIQERRLVGIPAPRFIARQPRWRPVPAVLGALAVAAAALLVLVPEAMLPRLEAPTSAMMQRTLAAAGEVQTRAYAASGPATLRAVRAPRQEAETRPDPPPAEDGALSAVDPSPAPESPVDAVSTTTPNDRPRRRADRRVDRAAEFEAIDAEAQDRWRRGDREGAAALFRVMIDRDPRGSWAQLAYGDLFTLARQRGDDSAELALWREYLKRYPSGTHSDDAQAGICRRSDGQAGVDCWRDYLDERPRGAFRAQAERALANASPPRRDNP